MTFLSDLLSLLLFRSPTVVPLIPYLPRSSLSKLFPVRLSSTITLPCLPFLPHLRLPTPVFRFAPCFRSHCPPSDTPPHHAQPPMDDTRQIASLILPWLLPSLPHTSSISFTTPFLGRLMAFFFVTSQRRRYWFICCCLFGFENHRPEYLRSVSRDPPVLNVGIYCLSFVTLSGF
ncbi:hypothetical protein BJ322DRAFT_244809 [Thelephora terrestris]|uniref:Uncharacterized protein n=1 Tax=Thelephora terrestris TaxID=56493 RepID=A0A9P6H8L0_9AGAM|nr:hypothetical protein BJ322DRAFT_244809 [Thelephora terrestris]